MSKTFFIADLHLGHKRALEFDFSWFNTIEDHDNHIIEQWNKVVTPKDEVWILGDISFHNAEKTIEIFNSLNGTKRLVVGNHDKKLLKNKDVRALFAEIVDYKELKFEDGMGIVLSHNPIPFYPHSNHGWYHLYGHLHNDYTYKELEKLKESMLLNHKQELKMYNVGCMTYEIFYTPRTLDEIIDRYNEHKAERKKDLQGSKDIYGIADVIASILYFFKDLSLEEVLEKIGRRDMISWIKMGQFCGNQSKPHFISEWNEEYHLGSATYNDIFKEFENLFRPEEEVIPIYNKLIGLYSDVITYHNPNPKYYSISDIHGYLDILNDTVKNISLGINDVLIFLGDYIDGGPHSRQTLEYLYELQERFPYNVVVLKGNHEELFLQWLEEDIEIAFLQEDKGLNTIKTFLKDNQLEIITEYLKNGKSIFEINSIIKKYIKKNYPELIRWMKEMPLYYATEGHIFVHAGIDEEAWDKWKTLTEDYVFTQKYPATTGWFYRKIVAGHIGTSTLAGDENFHDIYYDGKSHYYIDSTVEVSKKLNVLEYDTETEKYTFR